MAQPEASKSAATVIASFILGIIGMYYLHRKRQRALIASSPEEKLEHELLGQAESALLRDYSKMVHVRGHTLRVLYIRCGKPNAPLVYFIHGLGGQLSQWEAQIDFFKNHGTVDILALDNLGCGMSEAVSDWGSYQTKSLAQDAIEVLEKYRGRQEQVLQPTMVVSHSYGCAIATYLAAQVDLDALVMISPKVVMDEGHKKAKRIIRFIPNWLFDRGRKADRKGGLYSTSVNRFLQEDSNEATRRRQLRWNIMSRTPVYKRYVYGAELPGPGVYKQMKTKTVKLIGGAEDKMVPTSEMEIIQALVKLDAPLLVQGAGHMPMVTHADQVNSTLLTVLLASC